MTTVPAIEDIYPLTPLQSTMLFHALAAPRANQHLQQHVYEVTGPVTPAMLRTAFEASLARHTALRTGFVWQDVSRPVQLVWADVPLPWQVDDLRGVDDDTLNDRVDGLLAAHRATGFDLTVPPLLRVAVIRAAEDRMLVVVTDHHLIVDGWSEALVASELAEHLRAAAHRRPARLAPAHPFGEYVRWLSGRSSAGAAAYWRSRLGDLHAPTPLGVDRRGRFTPPEVGVVDRRLEGITRDADLPGRLRALRERGILPATLAHAAWALLLARHSGHDDVTFGATVAGRGAALPMMDTRVGMYANTLPLRLGLKWAVPVGVWLTEVQHGLAELARHEHSPHPLVQAQSGMRRGDALFESVLAFQGFWDHAAPAAGHDTGRGDDGPVMVRLIRAVEHTSVPLAVSVTLPGDGVWARLDYDANRFDEAVMAATLRRYQLLTAVLAADLDAPLDSVELPRTDVPEQIVVGPRAAQRHSTGAARHEAAGQDGDRGQPRSDVVAAVWEAATRWPHAIAVRAKGEACDYAELVRRSTRLAEDLDPAPGEPVTIVCRPSVDLVVAVLAVLRSGGSCWVTDPATWDGTRRTSGVRLLVADGVVVAPDAAAQDSAPQDSAAHDSAAHDSAPAIVPADTGWWAPTSADTARVPVDLRAMSVAAAGAAGELGLAVGTRVACRVPLPWAPAWPLLAPLTAGGCVLFDGAESAQPTTMIATAGQWLDLVAAGWQGHCAVVVDEPPSAYLRNALRARAQRVCLVYGTASGGGLASIVRVDESTDHDRTGARGAPIGRGVAGVTLSVRDEADRPVPAGIPGQLWLTWGQASADLAGRPDRYTGDRARQCADGTLELLGNGRDGDESALVSRTLCELPGVAAGLVLAGPDGRLRGWCERVEGSDADTGKLSRRLRRILPPALVPAELTAVERLPRDRRGRWDRAALLGMTGAGCGHRTDSERDRGGQPAPSGGAQRATPPLSDAEQIAAVLRWGDGGRAASGAGTITDLVAAAVHRCPEASAIDFHARSISYGELWRSAQDLAGRLAALGVRPGDTVAVCLPRTPAMVAAVLGVLAAGAAYLPIDPALPAERIRFMLADAGVAARISTSALAARLPVDGVALLLGPDQMERRFEADGTAKPADTSSAADAWLSPAVHPATPAYVLYTSGSTGTPKGVVVPHRAVVDFVTHINAAYGIRPGDRVLAHAALSFDVSVFDLFAPLTAGATVVLADDDDRLSAQRLQRLLAERRVTVAELPPALMPSLDPDRLPDLRLVSVGGEPPAGPLVDGWQRTDREFWNGYGPTETTVAVTLMRCRRPSGGRVPPIGRPMPNHRAYVVDAELRPVLPGVPGELCIAGPGLAHGYLGRTALTAQRFVPDPFGAPGTRMYRTGDLVRWNDEGHLEFLGRVDRQVKVRGFRVELGEVESVLSTADGVTQVAVEFRPDAAGVPVLVAYVTGPAAPDLTALRAAAARRLPYYMLPDRLVHLDEMPLTATGKVDRARLPVPTAAAPRDDATGGAASTDATGGASSGGATGGGGQTYADQRVADVAVLAAEVIGPLLGTRPKPDDDFFALGGDSLAAAVVVSHIRERFGVPVSLTEFFAEPTVACLAELMALGRTEGTA